MTEANPRQIARGSARDAAVIVAGVSVSVVLFLSGSPALAVLVTFGAAGTVMVGRKWPASGFLVLSFLSLVVPISYLGVPPVVLVLSPGLLLPLLSLIYVSRTRNVWTSPTYVLGAGVLIAYVLVVGVISDYMSASRAVAWAVAFALAFFVVPGLVSNPQGLRAALIGMGVVGGLWSLFAIFEGIRESSFLAPFFSQSPEGLTQKWSAYRVLTTIGHPLLNATFFAVVAAIGVSAFVKWGSKASLLLAVVATGAVLATLSRSGVIGVAAGVIVASLLGLFRNSHGSRRRAGFLVASAIAGLVLFGGVVAAGGRDVVESAGSAQLRLEHLRLLGSLLAATGGFGSGIGASDVVLKLVGGVYADFPLENSVLQLFTGLGFFGTLLFVLVIAAFLVRASLRGAIVGPSMFAAYVATAAGFNLFEAFPVALVLPMVALVITGMEANVYTSGSSPARELFSRESRQRSSARISCGEDVAPAGGRSSHLVGRM
ncbi:hypothetical protein [Demequina sp.]|uniref:hypothetical protein n=1 Tax=Demequina sp. TaxID=2050685 RepID=UPI003D1329C4